MREYHMADVIPLLGLPYPPRDRSSYYVPCPCCDSGRKKHLNINLAKDVFRCPRCGFSGGIFDLYAHYKNISRDNVLRELNEQFGETGGDKADPGKRKPNVRPAPKIPEVIDCPPTDIDTRDATYRALLEKLSLASDHRQNLLNRGLSEEIIARNGYRTTPIAGAAKALAKSLLANGHYLAGVPGFYRNEEDRQWQFICGQRGILIPVRDRQGRIQGLQVRRDNAEKGKFRWISSTELPDGCHAEGSVHIAGPAREQVLLIEGPLKADVVHHLTGQTVVAVPGVHSLAHLEAVLKELTALGVRHVMTAFDMDMLQNWHVQNGYFELIRMLHRIGLPFGTYLWHPEYNGLDDYVWEYLTRDVCAS